jgi:hypothetical protein
LIAAMRPETPDMTIRVGDALPPIRKPIFQRALAERTFSTDSIHNDDYTQQHGYPGALVSAYVIAGYVTEPLVKFFGESWFTTGKYKLKFIGKGLQQGDPIVCGAVVTAVEDLGDGEQRVSLDIWIDKASGVRPVVGQAIGVLTAASPGLAATSPTVAQV